MDMATQKFNVARFHNGKATIVAEYDDVTLDILSIETRNLHDAPIEYKFPINAATRSVPADGKLSIIDMKSAGLKMQIGDEGELEFPVPYSAGSV